IGRLSCLDRTHHHRRRWGSVEREVGSTGGGGGRVVDDGGSSQVIDPKLSILLSYMKFEVMAEDSLEVESEKKNDLEFLGAPEEDDWECARGLPIFAIVSRPFPYLVGRVIDKFRSSAYPKKRRSLYFAIKIALRSTPADVEDMQVNAQYNSSIVENLAKMRLEIFSPDKNHTIESQLNLKI
ncbi:hypothetical protein Tco_1196449, partial [Tanacetum coccineum]